MNTAARPKVLIIEDEERIRSLLLDFLDDFGEFDLRACASAEEALDTLERERVDLSIVDMRLPGLNGRDFILAARARGLCPRFLLHTGSPAFISDSALDGLGLSPRDVFLKPCDLDGLLERLRAVLAPPGA